MQVVFSATLSHLYRVLGGFRMSADITPWCKTFYCTSFHFYPCSIGTKLAYEITL